MRSLSGAEMLVEARYSGDDSLVGLTMPMSPSLTGKARSSQSVWQGGALPVSAGISREQNIFVRIRYKYIYKLAKVYPVFVLARSTPHGDDGISSVTIITQYIIAPLKECNMKSHISRRQYI